MSRGCSRRPAGIEGSGGEPVSVPGEPHEGPPFARGGVGAEAAPTNPPCAGEIFFFLKEVTMAAAN